MIRSVPELRSLSVDVIKIAQITDPTKTEGKRLLGLITDILDTVDDLVLQQGLSISSQMQTQRTQILQMIADDISGINDSISSYVSSHMPDLSSYLKSTDAIPYTRLTGTPIIPIYDLSPYQLISNAFSGNYTNLTNKPDFSVYALKNQIPDLTKYALKTDIPVGQDLSSYQLKTDSLAYSRLTGVPSVDYNSLLNKPSLFDGSWTSLSAKPTLVTSYSQLTGLPVLFNGDYTSLTNKPTIPIYDLSLYRLKTDVVDYTTLSNKPTIVTDYTQLANKPSMSKLLWNQTVPISVTNTTSEVNSLVTGNGTLNIDANPTIGTSFRLTGRGLFSLQTLTSPALTVKLYLGTTLIATGTSNSLLIGASNKSFSFGTDILITAANQVYAQGFFAYYAGATDALSSTPLVNSSGGALNTTVDLSIANQLKMTFTWSVASAANIIMVKVANIEKLNN